jgi:hypothetical protein
MLRLGTSDCWRKAKKPGKSGIGNRESKPSAPESEGWLKPVKEKGGKMREKIDLGAVYFPSEAIVAREIEGEVIIVPLTSGLADMEDDLYTLNETGKAIWKLLDGRNKAKDIVESLSREYGAGAGDIEEDIIGLLSELLTRKIIVAK